MSTPVVIRLKKKRKLSLAPAATTEATSEQVPGAFRLLLQQQNPQPDAKRPRISLDSLFVYAGRVTTADVAAAEAAVKRAIGKRKIDTEAERLRLRMGERPSEGEGRLVYKRQKCAQATQVVFASPKPVEPVESASPRATASSSASNRQFRIVDFELAGAKRREFDKIDEKDAQKIACNGVAMTTNADADDGDGDVYYDVYYGYSDNCIGDNNIDQGDVGHQQQQDLQFLLQAYEESYVYGDDSDFVEAAGGGRFAIRRHADSSSDSNSESNWRNDYPDTPSEDDSDDAKSSNNNDDDDVDDVDPYDDHVGTLASRLGAVRFAAKSDLETVDDSDDNADDEAAEDEDDVDDLREWRRFKQQLLQSAASADEMKE